MTVGDFAAYAAFRCTKCLFASCRCHALLAARQTQKPLWRMSDDDGEGIGADFFKASSPHPSRLTVC